MLPKIGEKRKYSTAQSVALGARIIIDVGGWYFEKCVITWAASRICFANAKPIGTGTSEAQCLRRHTQGKIAQHRGAILLDTSHRNAREGRKASKFILTEALRSHKFVPCKALQGMQGRGKTARISETQGRCNAINEYYSGAPMSYLLVKG